MSENNIESVEVLRQELTPVVQQAGSIMVTTPEAYTGAADFLKAVKAAQKRCADFFAPMKAATHAAWKKVTAAEAETLKPLQDAEATVKRKMLTYATEQETIRQEEQRRLQEQADLAARRERERLEKEAAKLQTPELKQARMEAAASVVAPVIEVASVRPVVAGQSIRVTWKARVTDINKVGRQWLILNDAAIQSFARSTKGAVPQDGIEFFEESSLSSTSK